MGPAYQHSNNQPDQHAANDWRRASASSLQALAKCHDSYGVTDVCIVVPPDAARHAITCHTVFVWSAHPPSDVASPERSSRNQQSKDIIHGRQTDGHNELNLRR